MKFLIVSNNVINLCGNCCGGGLRVVWSDDDWSYGGVFDVCEFFVVRFYVRLRRLYYGFCLRFVRFDVYSAFVCGECKCFWNVVVYVVDWFLEFDVIRDGGFFFCELI